MKTSEIGKNAALLSLIEVGLGSLLHGMKIPLSGHFLSLNQGLILTRTTLKSGEPRDAAIISTTAALLKSLSPAGKKLTPMLAIAMQGQLYYLGLVLFGANILGMLFGMTLLCLWGFLQPLAVYYLLYGETLITVIDGLMKDWSQWIPLSWQGLLWLTIGVVTLKIILGFLVVVIAHRLTEAQIERIELWARKQKQSQTKLALSPIKGALKDLSTPLFIFSWLLTLTFYFLANSEHAVSVWFLLRPLAVGFIFFYLARRIPVSWIQDKLKKRYPVLADTLSEALMWIQKN
jgi:hypothetical protein